MNIEICNYTKKLSKNLVLENINLSLSGGKIYGFVVKNGSGKTMLMRAICGLILPTSGFVKINNKIIGKDISFPDSVGALIENPGFISEYSGFQNLKILAQIQKKIDDKKIVDTMRMVGLDPNEKKSFRKYSLGMKQKLGIAAAMMEDPQILVLDEPFNALDEASCENVKKMILSAKVPDRVVLLSCHDKNQINALCDETIELAQGKIIRRDSLYEKEK